MKLKTKPETNNQPETKSSEPKNRWLVLLVVVIVVFMSTLDGSIVNVALPIMSNQLNVSSSSINLVVTSYLVIIAASILVFGRLGDIFSKTRVFKFGLILFTLGSIFCGLVHSFPLLIIARVVQAIGASATMATNQGIITQIFPANERGRALGITGTSVALGALFGPPLGGFIVEKFSWEAIFLVNIPVGILAFILSLRLFPKDLRSNTTARLDILGSILFMLVIIPLFAAIGAGQGMGFSHPYVLIGFFVSLIAFIAFIFVEKNQSEPLLDLTIFSNKLFSLSLLCGFIVFVTLFCSNIIQPFYFQDVLAYSPSFSGQVLMVYPIVLTVLSPISGYLSDRIGSEILTFIGLLIIGLSLFLMSTLTENSSLIVIIIFTASLGIGNALFQSPNTSLIMSTPPKDKLGIAGSVNALVRNLGMVCGVALATTLLYDRMRAKIGYTVTDYVIGRPDAFIYGMRVVYLVASALCIVGALLTAYRLFFAQKLKPSEKE